MKTLIEKFHENDKSDNPVNCIAFYLGVLCSISRNKNRSRYVDNVVKEGLTNFHEFDDLRKLNLQLERLLLEEDGKSKLYREKVSDYFMIATEKNFGNGDEEMMMLGVGLSVINPLESILTFAEASKKYDVAVSTLRHRQRDGRFQDGDTRKSGSTWLVTYEAMQRLYGDKK